MTINFDDFVKVIRKDHKVRDKINNMLDRYMSVPFEYRSRRGYDTLIQMLLLKN